MLATHRRRTAALGLGAAVLLAGGTEARAGRTHVLIQATHLTQGNLWLPNIRQGTGENLTFVSDGDVLGPGTAHPGRREVYLWTREDGSLQRLTNSAPGESFDSSRMTDDFRSKKSPVVAFVSTGDLDPTVGNADGNPEIFLWLRDGGSIRQVTDTQPPVVNAQPFPSDTGDCLLFQSTGDLDDNAGGWPNSGPTGFTNEDGSAEVFYIDFHDNDFLEWHTTQISDGPAGTTSSHGSVGGYFYFNQCANMTYQSDHDQLGNGSTGINVYDHRKQFALRSQPSLAGSAGDSLEPRMAGVGLSAGGPSVAFASDGDLQGRGTAGFHIYKHRVLTGQLRQLTKDPLGGHRAPKVSDGSADTVFETTGEPADPGAPAKKGPDGPYNADGNSEIYRFAGTRRVRPITRSVGCTNDHSSIMGNGRGIGFRSDCDLIAGHNPSGIQQAFVYYEVHLREPLYHADDCSIPAGCCSTSNGCYEEVLARGWR